jgi:molecular chaperone GrpE
MSEADDAANFPPVEPALSPPREALDDPIPTVDVESLEIVVSPHLEGAGAEEMPGITGAPLVATSERAGQAGGETDLLLRAVRGLGEQLGRRLVGLQVLFEREQRAEAARERVVDRLHAELQEYKQDLLLKVLRPIFIDLIQLHDDIGKMVESQPATDAETDRALAIRGVLQSLQTGIEDILYRQGVEPFVCEGRGFDPRRQRAVSTVATDDPLLGKTVAVRLRKGFQAGDKVIRPEIVTVYAFRQS